MPIPVPVPASAELPASAPPQAPPTQRPEPHSFEPAHAAPPASFWTHRPPGSQKLPPTQSASVAQLFRHSVAPQAYGAQAIGTAAGQAPKPSQLAAGTAAPASHFADRQEAWASGKVQTAGCTPSQLPPHTEPSLAQAAREPTGVPLAERQTPGDQPRLHAWHCPSQAPSQQSPSTQYPELHWLAAEQAVPFASLTRQVPLTQ